ncbi:hypothetical protein N431DRAFT_333382 [Stipitochalara longipes BDJ]|nr:hypothetical protein N431DRAFT_333382 [Stipitochalara longipes BDJ]
MPSNSRKPRTKSSTRVPTQWSEWEWSTAYNRFARYRLNESGTLSLEDKMASHFDVSDGSVGEYEYEYQAEEHNSSNPPFGHSTTTSQLCGEMRDTSGQVIDLGEVSRALEATREARLLTWTEFRVNHSNKFKMGCVFKVLWSEPRSEPSGLGRTELIAESSTSYHKIRQFIVVSEDKGHSMCIPILTYGSRGVTKDRIHPADHAMIYTSRQAKGEEKSRTNWKDARWWKCCEKGPARLEKPKILSYLNLSKTYGVENNLKVCFTGYMDETNVERLLCRDSAWEWSDTGEDILVIMEDQPYPSCTYRCWYRCWRLQLLYGDDISQKIKGLLGLSSGVMMSSSSVYLNNRMGLYESSLIMEKMSNAATFHHDLGHLLYTIPNELIFVSFVLGTAGLTGITVAWLRARNEIRLPTFGLTIAGALASWMLGFSVEEIILVCLPLILGCSILCSSVLLWKKARSAEKEEKIELISNV